MNYHKNRRSEKVQPPAYSNLIRGGIGEGITEGRKIDDFIVIHQISRFIFGELKIIKVEEPLALYIFKFCQSNFLINKFIQSFFQQ